MHELGLIENVLNTVRDSASKMNITRISKIKLVVGKLSMVLPDSLQFAFQVLSREALFENTVLEVEEKEVFCQCINCQYHFEVGRTYRFCCPYCGENRVNVISGRELHIDYYEAEEGENA